MIRICESAQIFFLVLNLWGAAVFNNLLSVHLFYGRYRYTSWFLDYQLHNVLVADQTRSALQIAYFFCWEGNLTYFLILMRIIGCISNIFGHLSTTYGLMVFNNFQQIFMRYSYADVGMALKD